MDAVETEIQQRTTAAAAVAAAERAADQVHAAATAAAITTTSSSNSSSTNVQWALMDIETRMWDAYHHMYSSISEEADGWVYVPPNTNRVVQFGQLAPDEELAPQEEPHTQVQLEDAQLYSIEDEIASEEPQVAHALDGRLYNFVEMEEHHFHCIPIADSFHGGEEAESVSSHCNFADPECMGPAAEWTWTLLKR